MHPGTGSAPPESPVPEPRATMGRPASCAIFTHPITSSVLSGSTTIPGVTRKLASPSDS